MRKLLVPFLISLFLCSCLLYDEEEIAKYENYVVSVSFASGSYSVYEGGMTGCYVSVNPSDSLSYYDSEFECVNNTVAKVVRQEDGYCIVQGVREGSTILKCIVGNKKAEAIINVVSNK